MPVNHWLPHRTWFSSIGDIGKQDTAAKVVEAAIKHSGTNRSPQLPLAAWTG